MPIFLYGLGALAVLIGAAMIGLGIPNNEFGIGNTLIVAGTTAVSGGLIVIGLGVAVAQLQRIADALATRAPIRSSRPFDTFDPAASAASARPAAPPARVPFPPKTKAESKADLKAPAFPRDLPPRDLPPREPQSEMSPPLAAAPTLPNPDEPPVTVADEAYLSPLHPASFSRAAEASDADSDADRDDHATPLPPAKPHTYFDAMWPAEAKPADAKADAAEPKPVESSEPKFSEFRWADVKRGEPKVHEPKSHETKASEAKPAPLDSPVPMVEQQADFSPVPEEDDEPPVVAILKSGVVDGMGYTLYVDGSIEAELPQGTLRFASINELRSHLEKTS